MRLVIKYSRAGAASYISHLDMQRAWQRALRRAGVDAQYSQGFNPHIVMSFAAPLSVGYATQGDYLEVGVLSGHPEEILSRLNDALPPDIRAKSAFFMPDGAPKLMALLSSADYEIQFLFENNSQCVRIKSAAERMMDAETWLATDRKGREIDIRPLVLSLSCGGAVLKTRLKSASSASLNPAVLAQAIAREAGVPPEYQVTRLECYANAGGEELPLDQLEHKVER